MAARKNTLHLVQKSLWLCAVSYAAFYPSKPVYQLHIICNLSQNN